MASADVVSDAELPLSADVPNWFVPSRNSTVPVGVPLELLETFAVKVTG